MSQKLHLTPPTLWALNSDIDCDKRGVFSFVLLLLSLLVLFFFHLLIFNWLDKSTEFYVVVRSQHSLWWATHLFLLRASEYLDRDVLTVGDGSCQRTVRFPLKRDVETQVVPFGCDTSSWISITVFVFAVSR